MKPMAKPDGKEITPPTLEEIIAKIKEQIPAEEGAFCRGDVLRALGLTEGQTNNLVRRWRDQGLIIPAGKVTRVNPWGDHKRVPAYRLAEDDS